MHKTRILGFLQGVDTMDAHLPSQRFRAHRYRYQPPDGVAFDDCRIYDQWEYHGIHPREQGKQDSSRMPFQTSICSVN